MRNKSYLHVAKQCYVPITSHWKLIKHADRIFLYWNLVALAAREKGHVGSENIGRRIAIRRSGIDRDVNFAKKIPSFVKMNMESINLTENPSDFVEPCALPTELDGLFFSLDIIYTHQDINKASETGLLLLRFVQSALNVATAKHISCILGKAAQQLRGARVHAWECWCLLAPRHMMIHKKQREAAACLHLDTWYPKGKEKQLLAWPLRNSKWQATPNLYLTKSAPENLATHWATSPFYLSHWMLIRRPNWAKQPAFQSLRLRGDETSRLAARHMLHPAAVHDTRFSHGGPPPSLIYWNEWLHIK